MVYRQAIIRLVCVLGVAVAAIFAFSSARDQMWANMALGLLGLALSSSVLLMTGEDRARHDAPIVPLSVRPEIQPQPFSAMLDQVPIPLLRFIEGEGFYALNLAARRLLSVDDFISEPPAALMTAVTRAERGARASIPLFDSVYALGISEVSFEGRKERFISLTNIQAEVRIAEATALGDTLRVISHEIMNSLTPVASLAETAQHYLEDETSEGIQSAREALALLDRRAKGLKRFVEGYRSLARLPQPVPRWVDVKSFVMDVVRVFERSAVAQGAVISLQLEEGSFAFDMDEALMAQAMINVLTNAAEATRENKGPRRVHVTLQRLEHDVGITVADNGIGIEAAMRERIFHGFITTKPEGAGIGLSLARQIALAHGGDLRLQDRTADWSSAFLFKLPLRGREAGGGTQLAPRDESRCE
ncbi:sensor histidine kinase [Asticcacaulis sp. 201]|uniref:sensor histidine kinase n=1 Tax=Asticcacaulis sp. 201 TaxID=3028787 RepID=UPI0029166DAC|nr:ATP-binding protein [Asticcacaulis sp. 201]MDV6330886.1 ATP-binding protein [Asticcacaulis sp. 201]